MANRVTALSLRVVTLIALAAVAVGCRQGATPTSEEARRPVVPLADLVGAATDRSSGQDALPVLDRLNDPIRVETEPRPNRHIPDQVDTLRTFHYAGLQFTVYDVTGSAKEIMQHIVVTDSTYTTDAGVHVGMSPPQVRAALGLPDENTAEAFVYNLSEVTPSQLHIAFEEGVATRLEWSFYVD